MGKKGLKVRNRKEWGQSRIKTLNIRCSRGSSPCPFQTRSVSLVSFSKYVMRMRFIFILVMYISYPPPIYILFKFLQNTKHSRQLTTCRTDFKQRFLVCFWVLWWVSHSYVQVKWIRMCLVIFYGKLRMTQDVLQVFEAIRVHGLEPHLPVNDSKC